MTQSISVSLPTEITYVTATVNSVAVTFTRGDGNIWTADVDKSEDNIYTVAILAYDSAGNSVEYNTILYYGLVLITNRTALDVEYAKQHPESADNLKGAYNADDMNRVESAVKFLIDRLKPCGFNFNPTIRTDWYMNDYVTVSEAARYLGNVAMVQNVYPHTVVIPTSMSGLNYARANAIEKALDELNTTIDKVEAAWFFSGDIYGGEI